MNRKKYVLLLTGKKKKAFISAVMDAYLPKNEHIYLSYYLFSISAVISSFFNSFF